MEHNTGVVEAKLKALESHGGRAGQRRVELLIGIARTEELVLRDFARVGIEGRDLLLPGVQVAADQGHNLGLLSRVVVVGSAEPTNNANSAGPFS